MNLLNAIEKSEVLSKKVLHVIFLGASLGMHNMDLERNYNLECHLRTQERHAQEKGWWEVKGMKWVSSQVAHDKWD